MIQITLAAVGLVLTAATVLWPRPMSWFWLAVPDVVVGLLAFPLAPLIVLATDDAGNSPRWCWPWLTDDNPIDGDDGHIDRWAGKPVWIRRIAWLWRNRAYNFSTYICGRDLSGPTNFWGNRRVSDNPMSPGVCWAYNSGLWEVYAYLPWPFTRRGLRIRLGWKIPLSEDVPTGRTMMVEYINPLDGYTK